MPLFRIEHAELLTPEALVLARARVRRRRWQAVLLLVLVGVGIWAVRPSVRAVRNWHSRRLAGEALALIDQQQWLAARDKAADAYTLSPSQPMALRAVGRLLARTQSSRNALPYYRQLGSVDALTPEDRRDFADSALRADDLPDAAEQSAWLLAHLPAGTEAPPLDLLLAAQVASESGNGSASLDFARRVLANSSATEAQQFTAAVRLVNAAAVAGDPDGPAAAPAWESVHRLADSRGPVGLQALTLLSRRTPPAPGAAPPPGGMPPAEIARALDAHPLARAPAHLLALDLAAGADPAARAAALDAAVARWRDGDDPDLAALAGWLLEKGQAARALDVLPTARTSRDGALSLLRLNALATLGRWADIETLLTGRGSALDPLSEHMYLAVARAHLDQQGGSAREWGLALEAAGHDPNRLYTLGEYAERQDAPDTAETAFAAAVAAAPRMRPAHEALCRVADQRGRTADAEAALAAMLTLWPGDDHVRNLRDYLSLLLGASGAEAESIDRTAAALAAREPAAWQVRATLALARLHEGHTTAALQAFAGLRAAGDRSVPPGALAVRAATLAALGWTQEARADARALADARLRPEERALIAPLLAE